MKYVCATKSQRFIIYLIDFLLISVAGHFIAYGVELLFGFDRNMMDTYSRSILVEFVGISSGKNPSTDMLNMYLSKYMQYFMVDLAFKLIIDLMLVVGLLIILPKFWGGKTLGRRFTNCKLIDKTGHDASLKQLILREILGTFIGYCVLGNLLGIVGIISLILVLATSRSLPDLLSGTYMVMDTPLKDGEPKEMKENEVEPNYTEINNEEVKDDSQDKYSIDNDDYKIE